MSQKVLEKTGKNLTDQMQLSLYDHLRNSARDENATVFYSDNCGGQNKNGYATGCFAWLVETGRRPTVEVYFMSEEHTKFSSDSFFDFYQKELARAEISLAEHLQDVGASVNSQQKQCILVRSALSETLPTEEWRWRD